MSLHDQWAQDAEEQRERELRGQNEQQQRLAYREEKQRLEARQYQEHCEYEAFHAEMELQSQLDSEADHLRQHGYIVIPTSEISKFISHQFHITKKPNDTQILSSDDDIPF